MVILEGMPRSRTDKLLAQALRLATMALDARASAEDLEELALLIIELDEAIVVDGAAAPARWMLRKRTVAS